MYIINNPTKFQQKPIIYRLLVITQDLAKASTSICWTDADHTLLNPSIVLRQVTESLLPPCMKEVWTVNLYV